MDTAIRRRLKNFLKQKNYVFNNGTIVLQIIAFENISKNKRLNH